MVGGIRSLSALLLGLLPDGLLELCVDAESSLRSSGCVPRKDGQLMCCQRVGQSLCHMPVELMTVRGSCAGVRARQGWPESFVVE